MRCFIYPKGVNGIVIGDFLKIHELDSEVFFLEDEMLDIFEDTFGQIASEDLFFVVSSNYYEQCTKKLENHGIYSYVDGIEWCGNKINQIIKKYRGKRSAIGIHVGDMTDWKYFADIDADLKKEGYEIVYLAANIEIYKECCKRGFSIIAAHSILSKIKEIDMIISVSYCQSHRQVINFNMDHGLEGLLNLFSYSLDKNEIEYFNQICKNTDFVRCSLKSVLEVTQKYFKSNNIATQIVPIGYLKLDKDYVEYQGYLENCKQINKEYVIVAYSAETSISFFKQLIFELLGYSKVVFLPHPLIIKTKDIELIKDDFKDTELFFEDDFESRMELFAKSKCLLTDCSSMGYTYPLTTSKPVVIFDENKKDYFNKKVCNHHYFDHRLHYFCDNFWDLERYIRDIPLFAEKYAVKIEEYRMKEYFGFGNSRADTIEFIKKILSKKIQE